MKYFALLLLGLVLSLLVVSPAVCQEHPDEDTAADEADDGGEVVGDAAEADGEWSEAGGAEEEDLEDLDDGGEEMGPSSDITVSAIFPAHPDNVLTPGEPTELLVGLSNKGSSPVFLTAAQAYLHYFQMWSYHLENYTLAPLSSVLQPGEQVTVSYWFAPHPMLEAGQFFVSSRVWYHDKEGGNFTHLAMNTTIDVVEPEVEVDLQTLLVFTAAVAIVVALAFYYMRNKDGRKSRRVERGTAHSTAGDSEWLQNTAFSSTKKRATRS